MQTPTGNVDFDSLLDTYRKNYSRIPGEAHTTAKKMALLALEVKVETELEGRPGLGLEDREAFVRLVSREFEERVDPGKDERPDYHAIRAMRQRVLVDFEERIRRRAERAIEAGQGAALALFPEP